MSEGRDGREGPLSIGQALAAVCGDRAVLARIAGVIGDAARGEAQVLATLDATSARTRRAATRAAARVPIPAGLRGVDPSWIEAALATLPPRARIAVAGGPVTPAEVWMVRRACAELGPLPAIDVARTRPAVPADVLQMSAPALRAWFSEIGRDQLAFALGDHAAALPGLGSAIERIARAPRHGDLGPRRAAIERARGEPFVIGARTLAPHLESVIARAVGLRFPQAVGRELVTELVAYRTSPSAGWAAVTAR